MKTRVLFSFSILLFTFVGCAYYNIMFNANDRYDTATKTLDQSATREITPEIKKDYEAAIDKCWKLINIHGEDSNYADDALLLIGKCYFQIEDYIKSERFLNQFSLKYQDSDLLPEAYLWLGRSLIKLNRDDEAIDYLNNIINDERDDEHMAMAWYSLGELETKRESYESAIENYKQCANYTDDDILASRALFLIGEIHLKLEDYDLAFETFDEVLDYDIPDDVAFDAQMKKVLCMVKIKDYDIATSILYNMLRDSRFIKNEAEIEARLGDCLVYQDEIESAVEQYDYVLKTFPRTAGSSNAAYGLAQIMETYYADADSAKKLYDQVKTEYRYSEYIKEAGAQAALLDQYLKLKKNIELDLQDMRQLHTADTTVSTDTEEEVADDAEKTPTNTPKTKSRTEEQIIKSLDKNRFALAEFFLLSMQNYDSALVNYTNFIETSQDTALKPKAMYSLAYIYQYHLGDSTKAFGIHDQILAEYPESVYSKSILDQRGIFNEKETEGDDYEEVYLIGEKYLFENNYDDAIEIFSTIAQDDSGSQWAEKSRYAVAWLYETKLDNLEAALEAYKTIVEEYPDTEYAKIARNKIKPPPEESAESSDSTGVVAVDSLGQPMQIAPADTSQEILRETTNQDTTIVEKTLPSKEDLDKDVRKEE